MFSDLAELMSFLSGIVNHLPNYGYLIGNFAVIIIVCLNLNLCRWMWFLLAGLVGSTMITAGYVFFMHFGGGAPQFFSTWRLAVQLGGFASHTIQVVGIVGLILSYRRKFHASRGIDYSAWTQPEA